MAAPARAATPTLSNGRVYTLRRDRHPERARRRRPARVVWSRNAAADTGAKVPDWGFSSSPLVVDDLVIVAASGTLVAYDARHRRAALDRPDRAAAATARRIW